MLRLRPKPAGLVPPKPAATMQVPASNSITLCASPFLDTEELWLDALSVFHSYLSKAFGSRPYFGDYEVARQLDVHRVITDHWLAALVRAGYAHTKIIGTRGGYEVHATALIGKAVVKQPKVIVPDELETFDPWTDRTLDDEIGDALFPDLYIDKFYEVTSNETVLLEKKLRIRPNGHYFEPVSLEVHPRYANPAQTHNPPPESWRVQIETLASGEKTMRRNR